MSLIPEDMLRDLWPRGDSHVPGLIAGIASTSDDAFGGYNIDSDLVVVHAMAQFSEECGAGTEMVENLNYSAQRLIEVWPKHFNVHNVMRFAHNPKALGNFIYEPPQHSDLGNRAGTDDGYDFRGRGLSQTTGRANYEKLGEEVDLGLLANPDLINSPVHALTCAVADFVMCGCLPWALKDDVRQVTIHLNGGINGLADRIRWLARWKKAFDVR